MNLIKSLIFSGIILASTVSSYYPVNVNGVDVEQFTITTDTEGAIFEIPSVGTGKVSCKLPSKETPRPIYTTNPNPEPETSGSVYYSEAPADQQSANSGESQVKKVIAPISEGPCEGMQYTDLVRLFEEAGFKLKELIIKEQHNCQTTGFWKTNSVKYNFLLIAHEYLFVFRK